MSKFGVFSEVLGDVRRNARRAKLLRGLVVIVFVIGSAGAFMALQETRSKSVDATCITLHGPQGSAVTLSLSSSGALQAQFAPGTTAPQSRRGLSFVLMDADGRIVARMGQLVGGPAAR